MNWVRKILGSLEARYYKPGFSLFRTLYLNFRTLPFSQAVRLPIFVYGKLHLYVLNGLIEFRHTPIKRGMVKIGTLDPFTLPDGSGFISLGSKCSRIVFQGPCHIDINSKIRVFGEGEVVFGKFTRIRSGAKLICNGGRIVIGAYTGVSFESTIINSSFHTLYNVRTGKCKSHIQNISIGERCWIANRSIIAPGSRLKQCTIVSSGSYVNKDFTTLEAEYQMLGGRPAKLLKSDIARIFSPILEMNVTEYFMEHPDVAEYIISEFDDISDLEKEF